MGFITGISATLSLRTWEDLPRLQHGRQGKYFFPNDSTEQSRLELQHRLFKLAMGGKLAWAPIDGARLGRALDIGAGTGAWVEDFAREHYPDTIVCGSDLSNIQPACIMANSRYVVEDSEEEWNHELPFDYIHLRLMFSCFSSYKSMVKKAFEHLRPGGWVEYQEFSLEVLGVDEYSQAALRDDPTAYQGWMNLMREGSLKLGRDIDVTPKLRDWLTEAGFVDVVEKRILVPISAWSSDPLEQELGRLHQENLYNAVEAVIKMFYAAGMTQEEVQKYIADYRNNLYDPRLKIYHPWVVVYGRKPYPDENSSVQSETECGTEANGAKD